MHKTRPLNKPHYLIKQHYGITITLLAILSYSTAWANTHNGFTLEQGDLVVQNGNINTHGDLNVGGKISFGGREINRITKCSSRQSQGTATQRHHKWHSDECDNGLPQGDCIGFISKAAHSGDDEDWQVLNPGEAFNSISYPNGGMAWWMDSYSGNPIIEAVYFCSI